MRIFNGKNILTLFSFLLSLIICEMLNEEIRYKCGLDMIHVNPIEVNIPSTEQNHQINGRLLDTDNFKEFNIHLDLINLEYELKQNNLEDQDKKNFFINGIQKAIDTLKILLKVKPVKNFQFSDQQIEDISINKWDSTKIGNNSPGMADVGIDLYIFVKFEDMEENTVASASTNYIDSNGQPLIGIIKLNKNINYSKENSLEYFEAIILHELIHILGFSNYYFSNILGNDNILTENNIYNIEKGYIKSSKVLEVAKIYFNCESLEGVELEKFNGEGIIGSHWEERILLGDIMNGVFYPEEQVISEITLAVLEDLGFYKVNYYTGGRMQYGKNKGCNFLTTKCVDSDKKINSKFKNEFFEEIKYKENFLDPGCSSGRQSRAYHVIYKYESISENFRYYSNEIWGGRASTNYCPVSQEYSEESKEIYYVGHCSKKGKGEYGSMIPYFDSNNNLVHSKNGDLTSIVGEKYSNNSFCVLSSLIPSEIDNSENYSKYVHAVCYQIFCSSQSLTIKINNDYIVCPRSGGKIKVDNYKGYLLCPDYYLICSGTILCNDIFDCIEKRSELKDNINYDYIYKTSQEIIDVENENSFSNEDSYELGADGLCPQYCSKCNEAFQCIKCKDNYGIVEIIENEKTKRVCILLTELDKGYYTDNVEEGIFFKCINNCKKCNDKSTCEECIEDYTYYNNNKCILIIENCKEYDDSENCIQCLESYKIISTGKCKAKNENCKTYDQMNYICTECDSEYSIINDLCYKYIEHCEEYGDELCFKCNSNYAFEEDDRRNCINKSEFIGYYTKDGGISYYKCYKNENENEIDRIQKCKKCEYNNNNLICLKCENEYILKNDEINKCYKESDYSNNNYYKEDENHIKKCSLAINNCDECEKTNDNLICTKCENEYILKDDETNKCYKESDYTNNKYYKKDENHIKKCSLAINNCDECEKINDNILCKKCENGYIYLNYNNKCINNKEQQYYQNSTDKLYYPCYMGVNNCERCLSEKICFKCRDGYFKINNDQTNCHSSDDINIKEYYIDPKDNYNYLKCSLFIENCVTCSYYSGCEICKSGFIMLNDNNKVCLEKLKVDLTNYYTYDNMKYYSCKDFKYKNDIKCFSIIPKQNIILTFLQVQIVNFRLVCYMITHSPLPKDFSLKLKINIQY